MLKNYETLWAQNGLMQYAKQQGSNDTSEKFPKFFSEVYVPS